MSIRGCNKASGKHESGYIVASLLSQYSEHLKAIQFLSIQSKHVFCVQCYHGCLFVARRRAEAPKLYSEEEREQLPEDLFHPNVHVMSEPTITF